MRKLQASDNFFIELFRHRKFPEFPEKFRKVSDILFFLKSYNPTHITHQGPTYLPMHLTLQLSRPMVLVTLTVCVLCHSMVHLCGNCGVDECRFGGLCLQYQLFGEVRGVGNNVFICEQVVMQRPAYVALSLN